MRSAKVSADDPSVALRAPAPVVPKAWPPPTKRRWRLGRRSRCPKFFARIRSQNFDRCHSFLLASSATGGARKRPPFHKGALGTGDADCCVGPGPPRNDNGFLSFRGQCAHWPWESVLFTMDGGSGRRGRRPLRKVYRSPSNGPMWSSAPTGGCGDRPAIAQAALSEAESAERAAGQIRSLPDDLRAQHGVLGSEV